MGTAVSQQQPFCSQNPPAGAEPQRLSLNEGSSLVILLWLEKRQHRWVGRKVQGRASRLSIGRSWSWSGFCGDGGQENGTSGGQGTCGAGSGTFFSFVGATYATWEGVAAFSWED